MSLSWSLALFGCESCGETVEPSSETTRPRAPDESERSGRATIVGRVVLEDGAELPLWPENPLTG